MTVHGGGWRMVPLDSVSLNDFSKEDSFRLPGRDGIDNSRYELSISSGE